jgi:hypothetical protein
MGLFTDPIPEHDLEFTRLTDTDQTLVADILGADSEQGEPDEVVDTDTSAERADVNLLWTLPVTAISFNKYAG